MWVNGIQKFSVLFLQLFCKSELMSKKIFLRSHSGEKWKETISLIFPLAVNIYYSVLSFFI